MNSQQSGSHIIIGLCSSVLILISAFAWFTLESAEDIVETMRGTMGVARLLTIVSLTLSVLVVILAYENYRLEARLQRLAARTNTSLAPSRVEHTESETGSGQEPGKNMVNAMRTLLMAMIVIVVLGVIGIFLMVE
jgi:uncharacterized Tic20 family protein